MFYQFLPWRQSLTQSVPVMLGYIPLGIAFGVLAVQMGHPAWVVLLMSLFIYSGAGQFLLLALLANGASLLDLGIAMFLLSSRHIFYGLSLIPRFHAAGWRKPYLMHALTDETYSLLSSNPQQGIAADFRMSLLNQVWWLIGTAIGVILGSSFTFNSTGMEFALTALFIVLAMELALSLKTTQPFITGFVCALLALALLPKEYMLLASIAGACVVMLLEYQLQKRSL